jgi:hypothetical protein
MNTVETAFYEFFKTLELEANNNPDILKHPDYEAFLNNKNTLKTGFIDAYSEDYSAPLFAEYEGKLKNLHRLQSFHNSLLKFSIYHDLAKQ